MSLRKLMRESCNMMGFSNLRVEVNISKGGSVRCSKGLSAPLNVDASLARARLKLKGDVRATRASKFRK